MWATNEWVLWLICIWIERPVWIAFYKSFVSLASSLLFAARLGGSKSGWIKTKKSIPKESRERERERSKLKDSVDLLANRQPCNREYFSFFSISEKPFDDWWSGIRFVNCKCVNTCLRATPFGVALLWLPFCTPIHQWRVRGVRAALPIIDYLTCLTLFRSRAKLCTYPKFFSPIESSLIIILSDIDTRSFAFLPSRGPGSRYRFAEFAWLSTLWNQRGW